MRAPHLLTAALALALTACGTTPTQDAPTVRTGTLTAQTFSGINGRIIFALYGSNNAFDLHTINPDGTGMTRLTDNATDHFGRGMLEANWSADGHRITFTAEVSPTEAFNHDIAVMNSDGSGKVRLTSGPDRDRFPTWSPDGTTIVFSRMNPSGASDLYRINADGSNLTRLTFMNSYNFYDAMPYFSPDGTRIAFLDPTYSLWTVPATGGAPTRIIQSTASIGAYAPRWSPDGQTLLFRNTQFDEIVTVPATGGPTTVVNLPLRTDSYMYDHLVEIAWSPDGTQFVMSLWTYDETGFTGRYISSIKRVNVDGSNLQTIMTDPERIVSLDWQALAQPANTAPQVAVTGVSNGAAYPEGQVPTAGCAVTDAEDTDPTITPTLSALSGPLAVYGIGSQTATCAYTDAGGLSATASATYAVTMNFTGFLQPVDNPGTMNVTNTVKAGSAVPVKFMLGGDKGLNVFQAGWPRPLTYACASTPDDAIETTVAASTSGLSYDPLSSQYTFVWKTDKTFAGSCRRLELKFADGTVRWALFKFTR